MAVNKEDLFKDFLANKQKKSEERQKEIKDEETKKQDIKETSNTKNRRNKFKKQSKVVPVESESKDIKNDPYQEESFLKFKEMFMSNQIVKDFMTSLDLYRERGFNMFENNDYFIKTKMDHPNCRAIIVEPSLSDIAVGKGGNVYIVKPMYKKEYTNFQKIVGDRSTHNEEFITYALLQCVLYPFNISESDIEKIGAGTIITLYNTISNLSDFNKNFTVVEV